VVKIHVRIVNFVPSFYQRLKGLEHATIRDNIIFGSRYGFDEARYGAVIDACALTHDLEVFDAGDLTGEFEYSSSDYLI
jgi:hypothetical protein